MASQDGVGLAASLDSYTAKVFELNEKLQRCKYGGRSAQMEFMGALRELGFVSEFGGQLMGTAYGQSLIARYRQLLSSLITIIEPLSADDAQSKLGWETSLDELWEMSSTDASVTVQNARKALDGLSDANMSTAVVDGVVAENAAALTIFEASDFKLKTIDPERKTNQLWESVPLLRTELAPNEFVGSTSTHALVRAGSSSVKSIVDTGATQMAIILGQTAADSARSVASDSITLGSVPKAGWYKIKGKLTLTTAKASKSTGSTGAGDVIGALGSGASWSTPVRIVATFGTVTGDKGASQVIQTQAIDGTFSLNMVGRVGAGEGILTLVAYYMDTTGALVTATLAGALTIIADVHLWRAVDDVSALELVNTGATIPDYNEYVNATIDLFDWMERKGVLYKHPLVPVARRLVQEITDRTGFAWVADGSITNLSRVVHTIADPAWWFENSGDGLTDAKQAVYGEYFNALKLNTIMLRMHAPVSLGM